MFKQIILPLLGVAAFIIVVGLFVQKSPSFKLPEASTEKIVTIGDKRISVQIAKTNEERSRGLSGVSSLKNNSGMLFVFSPKSNPFFWMKDMMIPLDMIWITDAKIVKIDKNISAPSVNTQDRDLKTYSAGQPIDYILEVNGGYSDKNGIKTGDGVDLSGI